MRKKQNDFRFKNHKFISTNLNIIAPNNNILKNDDYCKFCNRKVIEFLKQLSEQDLKKYSEANSIIEQINIIKKCIPCIENITINAEDNLFKESLSDEQIKLEIKSCISLIKNFANIDTNRGSVFSIIKRAEDLINILRRKLIAISENKFYEINTLNNSINKIDLMFEMLKFKTPIIIIERINKNLYESYIEDYDDIIGAAKGLNINDSIGGLKNRCESYMNKKLKI